MQKIILAIATGLLIQHAQSAELYKAKILDHKEWTTGNVISGHLTQEAPKIINSLPLASQAKAYAATQDTIGKEKTNVQIEGSHGYYIVNNTGQEQLYEYQYQLCANRTDCFNSLDHISIANGGYASNTAKSALTQYFATIGTYNLYARTEIRGVDSDSIISTAYISIRK